MARRQKGTTEKEQGNGGEVSRRRFIATAAAGTAGLAGILASGRAPAFAQVRELRLLTWSHFIPASDRELKRQAEEWGQQTRTKVTIDTAPHLQLPAKKAAEATAQAGHDIILLYSGDPDLYFDHVVDVSDLAQEIGGKLGGWYNAEDFLYRGVWKALPWYLITWPIAYRTDVLEKVGEKVPDTWEDFYRVGKKAKAIGHPIGIAISHCDDANFQLRCLMWGYGASYVAKDGTTVTLNSPQTVEAIEFMKRFFKDAQDPEVVSWDDSHNNRCLEAGKCFAIVNPSSAYESAKDKKIKIPGTERLIHEVIDHTLPPRGPVRRATTGQYNLLGIWKFSKNIDAAKDFLRFHYAEAQQDRFIAESRGYNMPFLQKMSNHPIWGTNPKYKFAKEIMRYTHPPGWPGPQTDASQLVMDLYLIPDMFAFAVTGRMSTKDAIAWAEKEIAEVHAGRKKRQT
ncbi:MAG: extracellular solute-binding protein [Candidatus Rokuibacteriota bacterium]